MIRISTPATSANLSVGFDTLGLALDLNNVFHIEESKKFLVKGFDEKFGVNNNIVLNSYVAFCVHNRIKTKMKKVTITLVKQDIPVSRGLGSSASCILAGVIAANEINNLGKTMKECAVFASELEGHPDNVFACAFGNVVASFKEDDNYFYDVFYVSEKLDFTVLIPETKGSTKELRNALKKNVPLNDAVYNLSRMIHVPKALSTGNMCILKKVLQDKLHEQYRASFIPKYNEVSKLNKNSDAVTCISGSGSTMLVLSTSDITQELEKLVDTFEIKNIRVSNGTKIEVL